MNFTDFFIQKFSNPLLNVVVFKNIIDENTRIELAEYSKYLHNNNKMSKNASGDGRYRKRLTDQEPSSISQITNNLNNLFDKFNGIPDPTISNIITYNYSGSFIQPHQDDYSDIQLRINIIVEKEPLSGNPIIGGLLYKIEEKDGWAFSPSSIPHGTTKLTNGVRINLSLGWNFKNIEDYTNAFVSISS